MLIRGENMPTLKAEVLEKINRMPDDSTFDDLMYEMYLINKIKIGQEQFQRNEFISHEQLINESSRW